MSCRSGSAAMINQDDSQLDSLAIAHYMLGGLMALFACFPLIQVAVGECGSR
jgi:hypothetical protein